MKTSALVPHEPPSKVNIADLLPMFPWEGPPLPRFLRIVWPWLQGGGGFLPSLPQPFVSNVEASYENEELIEWVDWRGRERKVKITRKAKRR